MIETLMDLFNLTRHEAEVMSMISQGMSKQDIADDLDILVGEVYETITDIHQATGTSTHAQLVILCLPYVPFRSMGA